MLLFQVPKASSFFFSFITVTEKADLGSSGGTAQYFFPSSLLSELMETQILKLYTIFNFHSSATPFDKVIPQCLP